MPDYIAAITAFSSIIATGMLIRYKVNDNADKLNAHVQKDDEIHTSMVDRLARIETKIDALHGERRRA